MRIFNRKAKGATTTTTTTTTDLTAIMPHVALIHMSVASPVHTAIRFESRREADKFAARYMNDNPTSRVVVAVA